MLLNTFAYKGRREVGEGVNSFVVTRSLVQLLPQQPRAGHPLEIQLFVHEYKRFWRRGLDAFISSLSDQRSAQPATDLAAAFATALQAAGADKPCCELSAPAQLCLVAGTLVMVCPETEHFFHQFASSRCGSVVVLQVLTATQLHLYMCPSGHVEAVEGKSSGCVAGSGGMGLQIWPGMIPEAKVDSVLCYDSSPSCSVNIDKAVLMSQVPEFVLGGNAKLSVSVQAHVTVHSKTAAADTRVLELPGHLRQTRQTRKLCLEAADVRRAGLLPYTAGRVIRQQITPGSGSSLPVVILTVSVAAAATPSGKATQSVHSSRPFKHSSASLVQRLQQVPRAPNLAVAALLEGIAGQASTRGEAEQEQEQEQQEQPQRQQQGPLVKAGPGFAEAYGDIVADSSEQAVLQGMQDALPQLLQEQAPSIVKGLIAGTHRRSDILAPVMVLFSLVLAEADGLKASLGALDIEQHSAPATAHSSLSRLGSIGLALAQGGDTTLYNIVMQSPLLQFGSFFGGKDTLSAVQALVQLLHNADLDDTAAAVPTVQELQQQYGMESSSSMHARINRGVWRHIVESIRDFAAQTAIVSDTDLADLAELLQQFEEELLTTFSMHGCDFQWLFVWLLARAGGDVSVVLAKLPKLLATVNMFPVFRLAFNILQLQYHVKLPCSLQALISMLLPANEAHKQAHNGPADCNDLLSVIGVLATLLSSSKDVVDMIRKAAPSLLKQAKSHAAALEADAASALELAGLYTDADVSRSSLLTSCVCTADARGLRKAALMMGDGLAGRPPGSRDSSLYPAGPQHTETQCSAIKAAAVEVLESVGRGSKRAASSGQQAASSSKRAKAASAGVGVVADAGVAAATQAAAVAVQPSGSQLQAQQGAIPGPTSDAAAAATTKNKNPSAAAAAAAAAAAGTSTNKAAAQPALSSRHTKSETAATTGSASEAATGAAAATAEPLRHTSRSQRHAQGSAASASISRVAAAAAADAAATSAMLGAANNSAAVLKMPTATKSSSSAAAAVTLRFYERGETTPASAAAFQRLMGCVVGGQLLPSHAPGTSKNPSAAAAAAAAGTTKSKNPSAAAAAGTSTNKAAAQPAAAPPALSGNRSESVGKAATATGATPGSDPTAAAVNRHAKAAGAGTNVGGPSGRQMQAKHSALPGPSHTDSATTGAASEGAAGKCSSSSSMVAKQQPIAAAQNDYTTSPASAAAQKLLGCNSRRKRASPDSSAATAAGATPGSGALQAAVAGAKRIKAAVAGTSVAAAAGATAAAQPSSSGLQAQPRAGPKGLHGAAATKTSSGAAAGNINSKAARGRPAVNNRDSSSHALAVATSGAGITTRGLTVQQLMGCKQAARVLVSTSSAAGVAGTAAGHPPLHGAAAARGTTSGASAGNNFELPGEDEDEDELPLAVRARLMRQQQQQQQQPAGSAPARQGVGTVSTVGSSNIMAVPVVNNSSSCSAVLRTCPPATSQKSAEAGSAATAAAATTRKQTADSGHPAAAMSHVLKAAAAGVQPSGSQLHPASHAAAASSRQQPPALVKMQLPASHKRGGGAGHQAAAVSKRLKPAPAGASTAAAAPSAAGALKPFAYQLQGQHGSVPASTSLPTPGLPVIKTPGHDERVAGVYYYSMPFGVSVYVANDGIPAHIYDIFRDEN